MIGKYGIPGENESDERIYGICISVGMSVSSTYFQHKDFQKYARYSQQKSIVARGFDGIQNESCSSSCFTVIGT